MRRLSIVRGAPAATLVAALLLGSPAATAQTAPTPPWCFEPAARADTYFARGAGVSWHFAAADFEAHTPAGNVRMHLADACTDARIAPRRRAAGVSNYYLGNDPSLWRELVPHYAELLVRDVRPGVDLVHHGSGANLEFDVVVRPGAERDLRLLIDGATTVRLEADGGVGIVLPHGQLHLQPPLVYQQRGSDRSAVACRYELVPGGVAFALGDFDPALELTIDPVVTFATLLGGNAGSDVTKGVGVDRFGNMAVTGYTEVSDFPVLAALPIGYAFQTAFVSKFDAGGNLVFSTFFGGTSGTTTPVGVGMDLDGQVIFGGNTTTSSLPTTSGVLQPVAMGGDWFFADLLAGGTLGWSTYYGGLGSQGGMKCLKVLGTQRGSVLGVGVEGSFPFMPNCYSQAGNLVVAGVFGGNVLWASSACGFSGTPNCVDVTSQGHICIAGAVNGISGLPTVLTSLQGTPPGGFDGFVFVFTGQANSLVFATYFGGSGNDVIKRIVAVPGPGTIACTIAGETWSNDLPLLHAVQSTNRGGGDAFVARFDGLTQSLDYSTYLGGSMIDNVTGLAVDGNGDTTVAGFTHSPDLPFTNTIKFTNPASNGDVWLAHLDRPGSTLQWCTAWGGGGDENLVDLALAPDDQLVIAGSVAGANMPVTANALPNQHLSQDAFLARIDPRTQPSYGSGTAGWYNFVPVLAGGGDDRIGGTAQLEVHDGRAQAFGLLAVGFGRTAIPFLNGQLLVTPALSLPVVLGGSRANAFAERGGGYLHYPVPIPNNAGLHGMVTNWQAAFLDAAAVGGIALTNGVEMTVR